MKLRRFLVLLLIPFLFTAATAKAQTAPFKDVPASHWASDAIMWAHANGLVKGYEDGTYKPNAKLTEAQLVAITFRYFLNDEVPAVANQKHWSDPYYTAAKQYGLPLKGYQTLQKRNEPATRGLYAEILGNLNGIDGNLADVVDWMYEQGITTGRTGKGSKLEQYDPTGTITRAHAAAFFQRLSNLGISKPVDSTGKDEEATDSKPLNVPPFRAGTGLANGFDTTAVQPTSTAWNRLSRFSGPAKFKEAWHISFDYDRAPGSLFTLTHSPVIGRDGTLYVQEGFLYDPSAAGKLYAIDPNGKLLWERTIGSGKASPVIGKDGTIYAYGDVSMFAFSPNGKMKWEKKLGVNGSLTLDNDGRIIATYTPFVGEGLKVATIQPDGKEAWSRAIDEDSRSAASRYPVVAENGTTYMLGRTGNLFAIAPNGTTKWVTQTKAYDGTLSIGPDGTVYIAATYFALEADDHISSGGIVAINPEGKEKWRSNAVEPTTLSTVIVGSNELLYVAGHNKIAALHSNGQTAWTYENTDDFGQAALTVDANGTLYSVWKLYNSADTIITFTGDGHMLQKYALPNAAEEVDSNLLIGHDQSVYLAVSHEAYNRLYKLGE